MKNDKPKVIDRTKKLMMVACLLLFFSLGMLLIWALRIAQFPIALAFVPNFVANILTIIAFWKHSKQIRYGLIFSLLMLSVCVVILQCIL